MVRVEAVLEELRVVKVVMTEVMVVLKAPIMSSWMGMAAARPDAPRRATKRENLMIPGKNGTRFKCGRK